MSNNIEFNLPEFVRSADSSLLDANAPGAFAVGGYRLDNPAAVWHAAAAMRKSAGEEVGQHLKGLIQQACNLFGITDDMFIEKKASYDDRTITITDGTNVASFCIVDRESLNAAADSVIEKRASLPYPFAHDCAQTVFIMGKHIGETLDTDKDIAIRKIAGECEADFAKGKEALTRRAAKAKQYHMDKEAEILTKLANLCTESCDQQLAKCFVMAADEFDRSLSTLQKQASGIVSCAEDDFFMSRFDSMQKEANSVLNIDGFNKVRKGSLEGVATLAISKWASDYGYEIRPNSDPEAIVESVGKMPRQLREEFVNLFA